MIFVAIHERTKQHTAHHAEDRGVCADAERKRHDDGDGEAFRAEERTHRETHIAGEALDRSEPARTPHTAHRIAREGDVAEFLERREARGFRTLTALDPLLDIEGHVAANLVVEIALRGPH